MPFSVYHPAKASELVDRGECPWVLLVPDIEHIGLWQRTLAEQAAPDDAAEARTRLRTALLRFRERAEPLAAEIARDLPEFPRHDVTHLDALWETADLIAGADYPLTPVEAFVLGGAFLIHDLGLALAAYPAGIEELKRGVTWRDTVTALLKSKLGRIPTPAELDTPGDDIERDAKEQCLRNLHASRAEELALISWRDRSSRAEYRLVEDDDLRQTYGPLIGRLAHSHWWPVSRLNAEFGQIIGSPAGCPGQWTVDPLKLACLLRVADASHLHAGRAPGFLRVLRRPSEGAREHWVFQEKLQQPQLDADRLVFTAARGFPPEEAEAWWLCHDTLQMVDRELRNVDALLADASRGRFAARSVAAVGDPRRFARLVKCDGWFPVDTRLKVSDVASLVRRLGGEALYGRNPYVPIRELVQNATDAVRARRLYEERPVNWGAVTVRLLNNGDEHWLEVEDTGIGMSEDVLCGPLLDFGMAYWESPLAQQELPGLLSKGFIPTGRYGIGFFSVFMLGDLVQVFTRRPHESQSDTRLLEFPKGLASRPLLRRAASPDILIDGGTRVRVRLATDPYAEGGFLWRDAKAPQVSLAALCGALCPALDANLYVDTGDGTPRLVVAASDWATMPGVDFLKRVWGYVPPEQLPPASALEAAARNLRTLTNTNGQVVGRACMYDTYEVCGTVTVGGLSSSALHGIHGVLLGEPIRLSRDAAIPVVEPDELARWASEQADLARTIASDPEALLGCAGMVRLCGGDTGALHIAEGSNGPLTFMDIAAWSDPPDEVVLIDRKDLRSARETGRILTLNRNVLASTVTSTYVFSRLSTLSLLSPLAPLAIRLAYPIALLSSIADVYHDQHEWPGHAREVRHPRWRFASGTLMEAVIEALAAAWSASLEDVLRLPVRRPRRKRKIGNVGGRPLYATPQLLVRNPNAPPRRRN